MNADKLNASLQKLLEAHSRYVARALEVYDASVQAQLNAFSKATEASEKKLTAELAVLLKKMEQ